MKAVLSPEGQDTEGEEAKQTDIPPKTSFQTSKDLTFNSWRTILAKKLPIPLR